MTLVRKLKKKTTVIKGNLVKMKDFDYVINFDDNTPLLIERYYKGLDLLEENNYLEAEGIFKSIVSQVWGHFDSLVSLISLYLERDDQPNVGKSFNLVSSTFSLTPLLSSPLTFPVSFLLHVLRDTPLYYSSPRPHQCSSPSLIPSSFLRWFLSP